MAAPIGRPRKEIDFDLVDTLCAAFCTAEEIAYACEVSVDSLERRIKEQLKPDGTFYKGFAEYFAVKSSKGRITLRKMQWASAKHGNVIMQMFLGKNMLNQTDKQQIDFGGTRKIKIVLDDEDDTNE